MRITMAVAMLAAMAAAAYSQEEVGNRMNYQVPDVKVTEHSSYPAELSGLSPAFGNRMNVIYGTGCSYDLSGTENRMNFQVPKTEPKAQPKKQMEQPPVDLKVSP